MTEERKFAQAKVAFIRQTARKVRRTANIIRNMTAGQAVTQLSFLPYNSSLPLKKLLLSAMANASHNLGIEKPEDLKISQLLIDDGTIYKRWRAANKGRAHSIMKRTSQMRVVLSDLDSAQYAKYVFDKSPRNKKKQRQETKV